MHMTYHIVDVNHVCNAVFVPEARGFSRPHSCKQHTKVLAHGGALRSVLAGESHSSQLDARVMVTLWQHTNSAFGRANAAKTTIALNKYELAMDGKLQ